MDEKWRQTISSGEKPKVLFAIIEPKKVTI
jgi:hypothetical protein